MSLNSSILSFWKQFGLVYSLLIGYAFYLMSQSKATPRNTQ